MNFRMIFSILGLIISYSVHANQCDAPRDESETRACIGNELRDSDRVINDIYAKVMAARDNAGKSSLRTEQRAWLKERDHLCHLDNKISNREAWIENILSDYAKTICVVHLTRTRIAALQAMQNPSPVSPSAPSQLGKQADTAYDGKQSTIHSSGKWYFEFTLNPDKIAAIMPTVIVLGVSDEEHVSGRMENITSHIPSADSERIGVAADLDNGKLYISRNGTWEGGSPGSNRGSDLKLGRNYRAVFMISAMEQLRQMLDSGAFVPNFGDHPLAYALPEGYSPWRNQNLQ